jgi:hypothetical protein
VTDSCLRRYATRTLHLAWACGCGTREEVSAGASDAACRLRVTDARERLCPACRAKVAHAAETPDERRARLVRERADLFD